MSIVRTRVVVGSVIGLLVVALGGCAVFLDMVNPTLATQLGLSTGGSQGVVLVAFNNTTTFPAAFRAFESRDPDDLTRDSRNFSANVAPGEVANEVLQCPVGLISPGTLSAAFAADGIAAVVTTAAGTATVNYAGPPLTMPDYACGDVIEIRLIDTGAGDQAAFRVAVVVIPG